MSVKYFMDEMREDEINDILENIPFTDKMTKELLRINALCVAQKFCKKQLKLTDICEFYWDKGHHELTKAELKEREDKTKYMLSMLNGTTDE